MGAKLTVQIDAALVEKMRAKAVADGLPGANSMPDEELLSALILALVGEEAGGATSGAVWVRSQYGLNLRAQPVSGAVLRTLDDGEELTLVGRQGDWVQVRASDGVTGWVSAEYISEQGSSAPVVDPGGAVEPASGTVWVTAGDGLNLRAQPVSGAVQRTLAYGAELSLMGQQGGWVQVRTSDGATGWVSDDYVSDKKPPVVVVTPSDPPDYGSPAGKGNVRGIHGSAGMAAPPRHYWGNWIQELQGMGMAWYKQLDAGDPNDVGDGSTFAWARELKKKGIEPIIRYYQGEMFPNGLPAQAFEKMKRYVNAAGVFYCEIGNEPNLDYEWHSEHQAKMSWQDAYYPKAIVERWISDAEKVVKVGARPGFYAIAPTDWKGGVHPKNSSVMFYKRMFEHVAGHAGLKARFRSLFEPGKAWLTVHVSTYEYPVDFEPFPSGRPPWDMCLRGYEIPLRYLSEILGINNPLVLSTEGGVFCKDSSSMGGHERLSSHEEHAQRTVEMFDFIQNKSPLRAMCPWLICNVHPAINHSFAQWNDDGWYDGHSPNFGPKPVVGAMKQSKP